MKIWVDADACPGAIKEILFRSADRRNVSVTLVANQTLRIPNLRIFLLKKYLPVLMWQTMKL